LKSNYDVIIYLLQEQDYSIMSVGNYCNGYN